MKKSRIVMPMAIAMMLLPMLSGCNSVGCIDNQSALPLAGFYDYETLQPKTLNNLEVGAIGAPNDSLILDKSPAASTYMPFNIGENETVYFIRYSGYGLEDPAMFDTLKFVYERMPYFASNDCGVMYKYDIKQLESTYHRIDSVALPRRVITNIEVVAIEIYFSDLTPLPRPADPDEPVAGMDDNNQNPLTTDDHEG
ncbi:MAG: hypothetical protein K2M98_01580 [Muribaculum sp.]|nr:hypothetical protein [Muribaculum sp.]